jgi:uncharacterized protein YbaA (DUF1428 family)
MARYADGYVVPMPTKNVAHYRRIARQAGKIWMEHGALQYCEAVGDDLDTKWGVPFPRMFRVRRGEQSSSPGSSSSRGPIATGSTRR